MTAPEPRNWLELAGEIVQATEMEEVSEFLRETALGKATLANVGSYVRTAGERAVDLITSEALAREMAREMLGHAGVRQSILQTIREFTVNAVDTVDTAYFDLSGVPPVGGELAASWSITGPGRDGVNPVVTIRLLGEDVTEVIDELVFRFADLPILSGNLLLRLKGDGTSRYRFGVTLRTDDGETQELWRFRIHEDVSVYSGEGLLTAYIQGVAAGAVAARKVPFDQLSDALKLRIVTLEGGLSPWWEEEFWAGAPDRTVTVSDRDVLTSVATYGRLTWDGSPGEVGSAALRCRAPGLTVIRCREIVARDGDGPGWGEIHAGGSGRTGNVGGGMPESSESRPSVGVYGGSGSLGCGDGGGGGTNDVFVDGKGVSAPEGASGMLGSRTDQSDFGRLAYPMLTNP